MNSQRSQLIFVGVIVFAVLIVAIGLLGRSSGQPTEPLAVPNATSVATSAPANAVLVSIESSNTKEDWLNAAIEKFNASGAKIASELGQAIAHALVHQPLDGAPAALDHERARMRAGLIAGRPSRLSTATVLPSTLTSCGQCLSLPGSVIQVSR